MLLYDYVDFQEKKPPKLNNLNLRGLRKFFKKNTPRSPINKTQSDDSDSRIGATLEWLLTVQLDDVDNEEVVEDFVTTLKVLVMEMSKDDDLSLLLCSKENESPLLMSLQKFGHHSNPMIKNTARLCFLIIFKSCGGDFAKYVVENLLPRHLEKIICFLGNSIHDLQIAMERKEKARVQLVSDGIGSELEYVDDILCLEKAVISSKARSIFFQGYVSSLLFKSLLAGEGVTLKEREAIFFCLCQLMTSVINPEFKNVVLNCFIPTEFENVTRNLEHCDRDFYGELMKLRHQMIGTLKKALCDTGIVQLLALLFLNYLYESSIFINNREGEDLLRKTYLSHLLKILHKGKPSMELESQVIYLITNLLGYAIERKPCSHETHRNEHVFEIIKEVKAAYMTICRSIKIKSMAKFASLLDKEYELYLEIQRNMKRTLKQSKILLDSMDKTESNEISFQVLFHLRTLILQIYNEKDQVLPILKRKVTVGEPLKLSRGVPCRKLVHFGKFAPFHYLLLTSSQVLVLQGVGCKKGVVIFNSYYKDLRLVKFKENCLVVCDDSCKMNKSEKHVFMKLLLKFESRYVVESVVTSTAKAKEKQNHFIDEKISNLLNLKFVNDINNDN